MCQIMYLSLFSKVNFLLGIFLFKELGMLYTKTVEKIVIVTSMINESKLIRFDLILQHCSRLLYLPLSAASLIWLNDG